MQTLLGAGGAISRDLARALVSCNEPIRLVARHPEKINETDELFPADITDPVQADKAIEGSSVVYLIVGFEYNIKAWRKYWPVTMQNVITACKKHKAKLVFFDNIYMYDPHYLGHMTEETPIQPVSKKGKIRAMIANWLLKEMAAGDLTALIARSADFLGPTNSVPVELIYKNFRKGKKANWLVDANKIHTLTYVPDAAKACALLGNTPDAYNQVWHLPTDRSATTGKQWIGLFAGELGVEPAYTVLPNWLLSMVGLFKPLLKEIREMNYQYETDYVFDSSKFEQRFNYTPVAPRQAVKELVAEMEGK